MITRRLLLLAALAGALLAGCGGSGSDDDGGGRLSDELLVGSAGNGRILRFDAATGSYRGVFVQGVTDLTAPEGIAQLTNGNVAVGDFVSKKVFIFSPDGFQVQQIGPLEGRPYTLLAMDDGGFLVSEFDSAPKGRIQRWHPTTGLTTFIEGGELDGPDGMVIRENDLFVASQRNGKVLRYGLNGQFKSVFAQGGGLLEGNNAGPSGIVFGPGGDLYVTQHDNDPNTTKGGNVLRFDGITGAPEGVFIPGGRGGLSGPIGILTTTGSRFLVTSAETNQVIQYQFNGELIGPFASGNGLQTPIYIAFRTVRG